MHKIKPNVDALRGVMDHKTKTSRNGGIEVTAEKTELNVCCCENVEENKK